MRGFDSRRLHLTFLNRTDEERVEGPPEGGPRRLSLPEVHGLEESLVEAAAFGLARLRVDSIGARCEVKSDVDELACPLEPGLVECEYRFGTADLRIDALLFSLQERKRDRILVVGAEQLLALGFERHQPAVRRLSAPNVGALMLREIPSAEIKFEKHVRRIGDVLGRLSELSDRIDDVWAQKLALLEQEFAKPVAAQDRRFIALLERDLAEIERDGADLNTMLEEIYEHQGELLSRLEADR